MFIDGFTEFPGDTVLRFRNLSAAREGVAALRRTIRREALLVNAHDGRPMKTYRAFGPILAAATALVASGCDTFPAQQAIGVTRAPDGGPEIIYLACQGESINSVEVVIPVDNPGGGDDTVLWRIESTQQSTDESAFVVGRRPPNGFVETVSLARALPGEVTLVGIVSTSGASETSGWRKGPTSRPAGSPTTPWTTARS